MRETRELVKENNELLRKIRRVQRMSQIGKIFYWVIILGLAFGAFYYIQPYIDGIIKTYTGLNEGINSFRNSDSGYFQDLVSQFNGQSE